MANQNLANELFKAMDILMSKQLGNLEYDKTLICTIQNADEAKKGIYQVTDGITQFTAFSENTNYKAGNKVYVTVPKGDMANQKIISGKYISSEEDAIVYSSPLNSFIDISNNLVSNDKIFGLKANGETGSIQIWEYAPDNSLKDYARLGIRASFKTLLGDKVKLGSYGIRIDIREKSELGIEKIHNYFLDISDMYGNPYSFSTFFAQEKLFDISNLYEILDIRVSFYQEKDFIDNDGEDFPVAEYNNLLIKDLYVSFGYDIFNFTEDTVLLDVPQSLEYSALEENNTKDIHMRWIHKESERFISIDEIAEMPKEAKIHWYHYTENQWEEIKPENLFNCSIEPDITKNEDKYKVIIEHPSREYITSELENNIEIKDLIKIGELNADKVMALCYAEDLDEIKSVFEELKTIYLTDEKKLTILNEIYNIVLEFRAITQYYTSKELILKNQINQEEEALKIIQGLTIEVQDTYKGVYNIYMPNNNIANPAESDRLHSLIAVNKVNPEQLEKAEEIIWYFPKENSMIISPAEGKEYKDQNGDIFLSEEGCQRAGYVAIKRFKEEGKNLNLEQNFRIKDYFNQSFGNNTIHCSIYYNKKYYETSLTLFFGTVGDSNNKVNLKLGLYSNDGGKPGVSIPALTLNGSAYVVPELYDYNGRLVDMTGYDFKYSWYGENFFNAVTLEDNALTPLLTSTNGYIFQHSFLILQLVIDIKNKGITPDKITKLIAYLPIAVRTNDTYAIFEGANQVIYNEQGINPIYYKDKFKLFNENNEYLSTEWFGCGSEWWRTVGNNKVQWEDEIIENISKFYPQISLAGEFFPQKMYYHNLKVYSVFAINKYNVNNNYRTNINNSVWTQPILCHQGLNYKPSILQDWEGDLTIDEKNGIILSTIMGAGIKNEDNTFSGVVMGDVSRMLNTTDEGIGMYGYHNGEQSFGFNIDGTAFIGSGNSKISFDGTTGSIVGNKISAGSITGTIINNGNGTFSVDANGNVAIKQGSINLGYNNVTGQYNFSVDNNGNITIKQGTINLGYNCTTGKYNFSVDNNGTLNATSANITGNISGSTISGGTITIGDKFKVATDGTLTCTGANITGNLNVTSGSIKLGNNFEVTNEGNMTANNAKITGNITGSSISGSTITGGTISIGGNFEVDSNGKVQIRNGSISLSNGETDENLKTVFSVNEDGILECAGAIIKRATISSQGNVSCSGLSINGASYTPQTINKHFVLGYWTGDAYLLTSDITYGVDDTTPTINTSLREGLVVGHNLTCDGKPVTGTITVQQHRHTVTLPAITYTKQTVASENVFTGARYLATTSI